MIEVDAEITGWRKPWGTLLTWTGGHYAVVSREMWLPKKRRAPQPGETFRVCNLHLRMIGPEIGMYGFYRDGWIVARARDPIAELKVLARKVTLPLINFIYRCELAVFAFRLKLPEEGKQLQFSTWCANHLL